MIPFTSGVKFEWRNSSAVWVDLTQDVLFNINPPRGTKGNIGVGIMDRVSQPGSLTLSLKNGEDNSAGLIGYYTPGHANCLDAGWGKPHDYPIRVSTTYDGRTKYFWYGYFVPRRDAVKVTAGIKSTRIVMCQFHDWFGEMAERKLKLLTMTSNKTIDQAVRLLMDELTADEQPQATFYRDGVSEFESVFDDTNSGTTVFSEFVKLAQSELSYIYGRADYLYNERLVVEGRTDRYNYGDINVAGQSGVVSLSDVSIDSDDCGFELLETGDYQLLETGDKLILDEVVTASFDGSDTMVNGMTVNHLDNAYRSVKVSMQQKETGAGTIVLWSMEKPLLVPAGGTITNIRGRYRDPAGGASYINGADMIDPVATTDYVANSKRNGAGSALTANIAITATYGAAEVEYPTIINSGTVDAYLTTLQARGFGVYNYDSLDYVVSVDDNNERERLDLDLAYETTESVGRSFANHIIQFSDGVTTIDRLPLWANRDSYNINLWMSLDIGSLYEFSEYVTAAGSWSPYYIQGYEFEVRTATDGTASAICLYWYPNGYPYNLMFSGA